MEAGSEPTLVPEDPKCRHGPLRVRASGGILAIYCWLSSVYLLLCNKPQPSSYLANQECGWGSVGFSHSLCGQLRSLARGCSGGSETLSLTYLVPWQGWLVGRPQLRPVTFWEESDFPEQVCKKQGRKCLTLCDLASDVTQRHFLYSLLLEAATSPPAFKGRGHRPHLLMGETSKHAWPCVKNTAGNHLR